MCNKILILKYRGGLCRKRSLLLMKEKIVRLTKRICFLPPVATLMIAIPSFAFLIVVLTGKINIPALDYIAYILSAYALIICVTAILKIINFVRNGVSEHPFMKWLLSVPIVEKFIHEKISEQK